uniref:Saposin B-type domain-containing protein n=1 Tax=Panagrellus redivivus TaxID=6233 RepID=A0A7E4VAQ1_PANRE
MKLQIAISVVIVLSITTTQAAPTPIPEALQCAFCQKFVATVRQLDKFGTLTVDEIANEACTYLNPDFPDFIDTCDTLALDDINVIVDFVRLGTTEQAVCRQAIGVCI